MSRPRHRAPLHGAAGRGTLFLAVALAAAGLGGCQYRGARPVPTAPETVVGGLRVSEPWVRAGLAGMTTAAYMTISNAGAVPDRLVSTEFALADEVQLHTTRLEGSQMRMVPLTDGLAVPAGGQARLAPGGSHLMMMGLKRDLTAGERVDLVLRFENAGPVTVTAEVRPIDTMETETDG
jgi:periplasmic copper chaperone A